MAPGHRCAGGTGRYRRAALAMYRRDDSVVFARFALWYGAVALVAAVIGGAAVGVARLVG